MLSSPGSFTSALKPSLPRLLDAKELAVLLPVHNEAKHLPRLLSRLKNQAENIILVDDGSSDPSAALARSAGVNLIRHPTRQGKTSSIRSALPLATQSEWILFLDGDGQHDPSDLIHFWNARQGMDAVLGIRNLHSTLMPWGRRMVNRLMSWTLRQIVGGQLSDTQCGYRLVRSAWLGDWTPQGKEYEWETELYGRLTLAQARVATVSIKTIYEQERSKIFWPRETCRFLETCLGLKRKVSAKAESGTAAVF